MPEHFLIKGLGGRRTLSGTISVAGAKNAALKGIAASILFRTPITLTNVPEIEDVSRMLEILRTMGASALFENHRATIDTRLMSETMLTPEIAKRLRASLVLTGPMLTRFGRVQFPHPGGCVIGERPIDLFVEGYKKMGAKVKRSGRFYDIRAPKGGLRGAEIFFRIPSVTGTETFMMAAVLAKGTTVIKNAAMEPEIKWLATLLNASGAKIAGAGTGTVSIEGLNSPGVVNRPTREAGLGGAALLQANSDFPVIPDRIEAGSFLILGALAAKRLTVTDVVPEHLESLIELLEYTGANIKCGPDRISVSAPRWGKKAHAVNVRTHEYPGFPTDLQAPMMVYLTQAFGESVVFETIFEGRLNYIESLNRMGANITMMDPHRVLVKGPTMLKGKRLESPDLRAGLAFIVAALCAEGTSEIHSVYNIDRGYERIEERLSALGADITRVAEEKK